MNFFWGVTTGMFHRIPIRCIPCVTRRVSCWPARENIVTPKKSCTTSPRLVRFGLSLFLHLFNFFFFLSVFPETYIISIAVKWGIPRLLYPLISPIKGHELRPPFHIIRRRKRFPRVFFSYSFLSFLIHLIPKEKKVT